MAARSATAAPRPMTAVPTPTEDGNQVAVASMSPSLARFGAAFVKVQRELRPVVKNANNPHFGNNFADLASILDEALPVINEHGFALLQFPASTSSGQLALLSMLVHESGEYVSATMPLVPDKAGPQAEGSAITYGRRYAACAILGIRTVDDDGNAGSGRPEQPARPQQRQQQPPPPQNNTRPPAAAAAHPLAVLGWSDLAVGGERHKAVSEQITQIKQAAPDSPALAEVQAYVKHRWPMSPDRLDALERLIANAHTPAETPQEAPQATGGSIGAADGSSGQDGAQSGQYGDLCPFCECPDDGRPRVVINGDDGMPRTWHQDCRSEWAAEGDGRPM